MQTVPQKKDEFTSNNLFYHFEALIFTQPLVYKFLCGLIFMGHPVLINFIRPRHAHLVSEHFRKNQKKPQCVGRFLLAKQQQRSFFSSLILPSLPSCSLFNASLPIQNSLEHVKILQGRFLASS